MAMQNLSIDFEELEIEEWEDEPNKTDLESTFKRCSSKIIKSSFSSITGGRPFFDYSSFMAYIATYKIDIIPEGDLNRVAKLGSGATMSVFGGSCPSRWGKTGIALKRLNLELPRTKSALHPNWEEQRHLIAAAALEIRVLSDELLRYHSNIVDLLGISWEELGGEDETQPQWYRSIRPILIVELAYSLYPTLDEYYKYSARQNITIDLDTKISILSDVADALSAVHICGVIHGDIKPQNVLIFRKSPNDPLIAKLSDFGGCQPSIEDEASMHEFSVLGTEYWNAPEVIDAKGEPTMLSRRVTRDYYSMGLVIYYVLFGDMLFGDDEDDSHGNLERITEIKNDQSKMQQLIKAKMASHWIAVGKIEALKEIWNESLFENRLEIFRRLYTEKEVAEIFLRGHPPRVTTGEECRQYSLYLVMRLFLHHNPEIRKRGDLMAEFRVLIGDSYTTRVLRDVYLMSGWENMQSNIEKGVVDVWDVRDFGGTTPAVIAAAQHRVTWINHKSDITSEFSNNINFDDIDKIPHSLRNALVQELKKQAGNVGDPGRIRSLLSLEYYQYFGYLAEDFEPMKYALEAAKLGSVVARLTVLSASKIYGTAPLVEQQVECEWMLDHLFAKMPAKDRLIQQIFRTFPDPTFLATILYKESNTLAFWHKEIKAFEPGDGELEVKKLFEAVISGKVDQVKALLRDNAMQNLNTRLNGFNILHVASERGNHQLIRVLINDFGMDVNELNDQGVSPAALAARACRPKTVSVLLKMGADFKRLICARTLRQVANYGSLPALYQFDESATAWSTLTPHNPLSMNAFLDGNFTAYPDDELEDGNPEFPPIFSAMLGDNLRAFWWLLEQGCSRNIYTEFTSGFLAPIHVAANLRPLFLAILLHYGALPDIRTHDHHQSTALQLVCVARRVTHYNYPRIDTENPFEPYISFDSQPSNHLNIKLFMVRLLVKEYEADVDAQDWFGRTAVYLCISESSKKSNDTDSLAVTRYLVEECGADIHIKDFRGGSCLHRALAAGAGLEYVEFCVQHGLNLNEKDIAGFTPLMLAASSSTLETCQYLVNHGAELLIANNLGETCLDSAIYSGCSDKLEYLFGIAEERNLVSALVPMLDSSHQTLTHRIIRSGTDNSSKYLSRIAKADTPIDLEKPDIVGYTLLHHAVLARNLPAIEFLLQAGSNVNAEGWRDLTPLHIAYAYEKKDSWIIQTLEKVKGINLKCLDAAGRTPEALSKLCAEDPEFWQNYLKLCNEEGDEKRERIDEEEIEAENRRNGAPKEGWFSV